jgi:hypothetical protein
VSHAYFMTGEYEKSIATDLDEPSIITILALDLMGERERAIAHARQQLAPGLPHVFRLFFEGTLAVLEERRGDACLAADKLLDMWRFRDPCGTYYFARALAAVQHPQALAMFRRAVEGGFHCSSFFSRDPWLESLRDDPGFRAVIELAEARRRDAAAAFGAAGGEQMLGPVEQD